jgi:site-specific DNA recombinase
MRLGKDIGPGNWEPILGHDTFARLVSLLRDPARRTNTGAPRSRYLLSGIARCGRCPKPGVPMRVLAPAGKVPAYVRPECFLRRSRERVDELVTTVMVELLAKPTALEILAQTTDDGEVQRLTDQRDTLRAKLVNVQDDYIEDRITEDQRDHTTAMLRPKLERVETQLRAALDTATGALDLMDLCREDIAEIWDHHVPLERKRAAINALLTIQVLPLGSGKRWDPRSVKITVRSKRTVKQPVS